MTSKSPHAMPGKEFAILMASLMSIVAISIDALLPALGDIATDLQLTQRNDAQYVIGFMFVGMALGQLVSGPLSDAIGRKKALYSGIALYLAGSVLCLSAESLTVLLWGRFIQGLGVSGPYISAVSIVRDQYSGRQMARVMSLVMMIFIMVPAVAPAIGQTILFYGAWRMIFWLYIAYALVIVIWLFFRLKETLPPEKRIPFSGANIAHGLKEVLGNRKSRSYMMCMGLCFGGLIGYLNSSQQIFQEQFGVGSLFALYFGGLALIIGIASLVNAQLVERVGMRLLCQRAFMAIVISSAVFLLITFFVDITLLMFLAYASTLFFSFGLIFGNLNALAMEPMGHIAGIAAAIIGAGSSTLSMTLGVTIGQLYNGTLIPMTVGFMLLSCCALLMMRYAESGVTTP